MEEMESKSISGVEQNENNKSRKDNELILLSVSDAEQMLEEWAKDPSIDKSLPELIVHAIDTSGKIFGSAVDYHNLASEFARQDLYKNARIVAVAGAKKYKKDVDLLADIILFGSKSDSLPDCERAFCRLKEIDKSRWSWRAFKFSIDYFKVLIATDQNGRDKEYYSEALTLADEYKKYLGDERAWVAVSELYSMFGRTNAAIQELKDGVERVIVSPQCCLKLSDMLLESGDYNGVIKYSAIGIRAAAQEQPSSSVGYLYYLSALAKDALIHQEELESPATEGNGFSNFDRIKNALCDYDIALKLLSNRTYTTNIIQRKLILFMKSGIRLNETDDSD